MLKLNPQFVVVDRCRSKLLGHYILSLVTDWPQFLKVQQVHNVNKILNNWCQKFSDIFGLGVKYDERGGSMH